MRPALLGLALVWLFAAAADAQELRGRVVRDGAGVPGAPVTLHRVARDTSGIIGVAETGPNGTFRFAVPPPSDTGFAVLFATTEWQGVRYFGAPLHPTQPRGDYQVPVFDTAHAVGGAPRARLARRDVILLPEQGNGWEVNEVLRIDNPDSRTWIAPEGLPTFEFPIPENAVGFEAGDGGFGLLDVRRMGSRVLVVAPLRPGSHELVVRYRIPRSAESIELPTGSRTDEVNLLVRQPAPELEIRGMTGPTPETLAGETFQRYAAGGAGADSVLHIEWRDPARAPVSPVLAASLVVGLLLLGGTGVAVRNRRSRAG